MGHLFKALLMMMSALGCMSKWTPIAALSFVAVGAQGSGTSSASPGYPAGLAAGNLIELWVVNKYPANPPTTPSGWILLDSYSGGAGSPGDDSGEVLISKYIKIADGTEAGTLAITVTGGNSVYARMTAWAKDYRMVWDVTASHYADNTGGTSWTGATLAGLTTQPGDVLTSGSAVNTDAFTFGSRSFSQTGVTFGSVTNHIDTGTSGGNDCKLVVASVFVTSGSGTGAVTYSMTATGSTADSPAGATSITRIRQQFNYSSLLDWDPSHTIEPSNYATLDDGQYFWFNSKTGVGLRSSEHWSGLNYSLPEVNGIYRFRSNIYPRDPDFSSENHYNYRAEVSQNWKPAIPLYWRQTLSWFYIVPDEGLLDRDYELTVHQSHPGSAAGYSSNSPCYYFGLARAGQVDKHGDPAAFNELVVVNKVTAFEDDDSGRTNTGIVANPGDIIYLYCDTVFGNLNIPGAPQGSLQLRVCVGTGGSWTTVYNEQESTVWAAAADGGSEPGVGGAWKVMMYAHGIRTLSEVEANEALNGGQPGDYYVIMDTGRIRAYLISPTSVDRFADVFPRMDLSKYG